MFNKDFYPTPVWVIKQMTRGLDFMDKVIFDPESGKGDILKFCKERDASKLLGCEINSDLYKISSGYANMIGTDFLQITKSDISHVDFIIMNPPFSADIKHILHAWEIAPDGCKIRALCNNDTLKLDRLPIKRLKRIAEENDGGSVMELGTCFTDAERKTLVNVALITLDKPEKEQEDWDSYFSYEPDPEHHQQGLMAADAITEIVGRYVGSLKMFESVQKLSTDINELMKPINMASINFGCTKLDDHRHPVHLGYESFKVELQKSAWSTVFKKMNMGKYMTETLKDKINQFVEQQSETPFTVANIYNMLYFINNTNASRMNEVLIEVFDKLTQHYDDNRYHLEGWKTNSHYMINKKMIVPYMTQKRYGGGIEIHYNGNGGKIDDLTKALCYLTGQNYDDFNTLSDWASRTAITDPNFYWNNPDILAKAESQWNHYSTDYRYKEAMEKKKWTKESWIKDYIERKIERRDCMERRDFGKWYDWGFFEVKGFKKGTMHFKFKDDKIWELFNRTVAEAKGFELPEHVAFI